MLFFYKIKIMKMYFVVFNIHKFCYYVEYVCYVVFICQLISLKKYIAQYILME